MAPPLGIYVHIPFCVRKCYYCDFNAGPASQAARERYVVALCCEILYGCRRRGHSTGDDGRRRSEEARFEPIRKRVDTIFFGGGTPSELATEQLERIVWALREAFAVDEEVEWTLEANPGTVTPASLAAIRAMGFNRISVGVQSFHDHHLQRLGRIHSAAEAEDAFRWAREASFASRNLDLIFGLPHQTAAEWERDLERAIALKAEHLSLYGLTIEKGTLFGRMHAADQLLLPDEDLSAQMYEHALDRLAEAGYEQYEISNWALPGHRCRHNMRYWRNEPSLGFGVSAASYMDGVRWKNVADWNRYEERATAGLSCIAEEERLEEERAAGEAVMLALRTRDGADLRSLSTAYSCDLDRQFAPAISRMKEYGLLEEADGRLRLTRPGLLVADRVLCEFV
jgi:oxygen-independent coproporphyrinogen-3 oxidase